MWRLVNSPKTKLHRNDLSARKHFFLLSNERPIGVGIYFNVSTSVLVSPITGRMTSPTKGDQDLIQIWSELIQAWTPLYLKKPYLVH